MGRKVEEELKQYTLKLINDGVGQRAIESETGLSRQYIRKLAKSIGKQFPRNGIEVVGSLCMCCNCGCFFRRPHSKKIRARQQFCDEVCKYAFAQGPGHPNWKTGASSSTFSNWVKNQSEYKEWREAVLARDNYQCSITGKKDDLQVHHILPKAEGFSPEKAFDVNNGITLCREAHNKIHELLICGVDFFEAIERLRKEYNNEQ